MLLKNCLELFPPPMPSCGQNMQFIHLICEKKSREYVTMDNPFRELYI